MLNYKSRGTGVDPSFLAALPEDMREEVIEEQRRLLRARAAPPAPPAQQVAFFFNNYLSFSHTH